MKQTLLNEALGKLRLKKQIAEKQANQNLKSALKDKDFSDLYNDYTNSIIENAKCEAFGLPLNDSNLSKIKYKVEKKLSELKVGSIFPEYSCPKCEDSGLVNGKYCDCLKREITDILLKKSGFKSLESFKNSDFSIFENEEEIKKIYKLMETWCNKTDSNKNLIYLLGETGTGKTHLMKCMANEFISQNKIVLLLTAFEMHNTFVKYHTAKDNENLLDDILSCEVLFIDDLGTEPFFKNITKEYFYLIINERRMKNLKTVITSNLSPNDLKERYDERIFSRIMDKDSSVVLELKGKDKRLLKRK